MSAHELMVGIERISHKWGWFLALGILLMIVGVIAIASSVATTVFSILFLGILLIIGGAMQMIHSFEIREWGGFLLHLLGGILTTVVGMLAVSAPAAGALAITLMIAVYLLVGGLFRVISAIAAHFPAHGLVALSGLISFLLGMMLWAQWPVSGLWFIGMCVGIDLIFHGASWIAFALAARRIPRVLDEMSPHRHGAAGHPG
jgi:uncharacterized membrane protein HdeD (DUF308 family)